MYFTGGCVIIISSGKALAVKTLREVKLRSIYQHSCNKLASAHVFLSLISNYRNERELLEYDFDGRVCVCSFIKLPSSIILFCNIPPRSYHDLHAYHYITLQSR